jgi:hypothetical protein
MASAALAVRLPVNTLAPSSVAFWTPSTLEAKSVNTSIGARTQVSPISAKVLIQGAEARGGALGVLGPLGGPGSARTEPGWHLEHLPLTRLVLVDDLVALLERDTSSLVSCSGRPFFHTPATVV